MLDGCWIEAEISCTDLNRHSLHCACLLHDRPPCCLGAISHHQTVSSFARFHVYHCPMIFDCDGFKPSSERRAPYIDKRFPELAPAVVGYIYFSMTSSSEHWIDYGRIASSPVSSRVMSAVYFSPGKDTNPRRVAHLDCQSAPSTSLST